MFIDILSDQSVSPNLAAKNPNLACAYPLSTLLGDGPVKERRVTGTSPIPFRCGMPGLEKCWECTRQDRLVPVQMRGCGKRWRALLLERRTSWLWMTERLLLTYLVVPEKRD